MAGSHDEPLPRWGHVAVVYNGKVYIWGGRTIDASEDEHSKLISVVEEFDPVTMSWAQIHASGDFPQWPERCVHTCTRDGSKLYVYGGYRYHDHTYSNSLYMLTLGTMVWEEIHCSDPQAAPGRKVNAGMVIWNNDKLVLFGGYGCPPDRKDPRAKYIKNSRASNDCGWTNDLYICEITERSWRFQPSKGTPPPCNGFSFVLFQNNYVFKYGGTEPFCCVSKMHILDLTQPACMEWNELNIPGPLPCGRKFHTATSIATDPECSKCLIIGGDLGNKDVSGEIWLFDYIAIKWTQLSSTFEVDRYWHTASCITLDSSKMKVVVFGGCDECQHPPEPMSGTAVFDLDTVGMTTVLTSGTVFPQQLKLKNLDKDVGAVIPSKWRAVGLQLKLPPNTLDNIQSERNMSNVIMFKQVFREWKKQYPESYSWITLIDALEKPHVCEVALAKELRNKHVPQ